MTPGRVVVAGVCALLMSLIRTAWLSDDAYISFRTADNILHGYGPVWNVGERVQAFTHPLWLALCTAAFAVTGNVYYTAIILGVVLTVAAVFLIAGVIAPGSGHAMVVFCILLSSKAFIDFSTSGLENPLSHLLLAAFLFVWWREPAGVRQISRLAFVAALIGLTRVDLLLIVGVPLAAAAWQVGRSSIMPLAAGLAPLAGWHLFAVFYYGTPWPNTAYAKLSVSIPWTALIERGTGYLWRTLVHDPVTLPAIAAGWASAAFARNGRDWSIAAGVLLYVIYVVRIGGDFMMGRFLAAPLFVATAALTQVRWLLNRTMALASSAAALVVGLLAPWEPALLSGYGYSYANNWVHGRTSRRPADDYRNLFVGGVIDERRNYAEFASLLKVGSSGEPVHMWSDDGKQLRRQGKQVVVRSSIGLVGYYAGPEVHIIDAFALSDPLLARLPAGHANSMMGHFERRLPPGYLESVESGRNQIADPDLAAYYTRLRTVVSDPLWNVDRLRTTAALLAGRFEHHRLAFLGRQSDAE